VCETAEFHHRGTEAQRHRTIKPSQARRRKDTKESRSHRTIADLTQRRRGAEAQSHRSGDSRSVGRVATVRNRGIEVLEGRSATASACRPNFQHLGSRFQRAHPASVDSRSAASSPLSLLKGRTQRTSREGINPSPIVTLSEGVRRPSRRVSRGWVCRSSPERNAIDRRVLPTRRGCFDSLRSLSMTGCVRPCPPPQWRPVFCSAGVPPAPRALMQACWIRVPSTSPSPARRRRYKDPRIFKSTAQLSPRRSRCAEGAAGRGIDWTRQKLVFGASRRFHGGGGRRPQPTPPSISSAMLRCLRVRCLSAFASSRLRRCDAAMPLCLRASVVQMRCCDGPINCDAAMTSRAMSSRLRVFVLATSATLRRCGEF
jgi:hypothetical protein